MTAIDRLELELTEWLVDTAVPLGADDIDALLQQTAGVRQRPRWTFLERWLPMRGTALPRPILTAFPLRPVALLVALALLIAAIVAIGIGSRPRLPAPFAVAGNGQVAIGRGGDLYAVDPASGVGRALVTGVDDDAYPAYSLDGTKVAFERTTGGASTLMVVGVDRGSPVAVSDRVDGIFGLQWSPGGDALVFSNGDLVVVAADGSGGSALPIKARSQGFPTWRPPDGGELLFLGTHDGATGSYLVRRDGSDLRPITQPDGSLVNDGLAQWLPDGRRIMTRRLTTSSDGGVELRIHVMTLDDAGRVTDDRVVGPAVGEAAVGYSLSRDGTQAIAAIPQADGGAWRVGVVPLDGGPVVETGPTFHGDVGVAWAPDGEVIVANDTSRGETWLLDAAGGVARPAPWETDSQDAPAWQPVAR
jgi:dipeptidyl aminopeptidase/acylaminoacyl peptidase